MGQIKNIKLHIVTDIKKKTNSVSIYKTVTQCWVDCTTTSFEGRQLMELQLLLEHLHSKDSSILLLMVCGRGPTKENCGITSRLNLWSRRRTMTEDRPNVLCIMYNVK